MLVYLASPYTAPTEQQKKSRFEVVCKDAAFLMDLGYEVFCPIAHSHPIEQIGMDELRDADFWLKQDFAILKNCDALVVDDLIDGWDRSEGVYREVAFAYEHGIPVEYLSDCPVA